MYITQHYKYNAVYVEAVAERPCGQGEIKPTQSPPTKINCRGPF